MLAFDTNIVFYAFNRESPFHGGAATFLASLAGNPEVVVSELIMVEFYRLLRSPVLNERPLNAGAATRAVEAYRRHPVWRLAGFPSDGRRLHNRLWEKASRRDFPYKRIYDARLALSLVEQGVDEFATANVKDFQDLGFRRVWNPLEG